MFFLKRGFYAEQNRNDTMNEDLSRPCDACGKPIGVVIVNALDVISISVSAVAIN